MKKDNNRPSDDLTRQAWNEEAAAEQLFADMTETAEAKPAEQREEKEPDPMKRLTELENENNELKDKYLRSMAEFENFRRRSNQEKSEWIKLATQKLALEICDVMDNFERALCQVEDSDRDSAFVKGVTQIEQQLRGILGKEGVCRIEALGTEFDPSLHEALAHVPSDYDANQVAVIIQNGYTMHNKVLRPVRVAVSSGKPENAAETEPPAEDKSSGGKDPDIINIEVR